MKLSLQVVIIFFCLWLPGGSLSTEKPATTLSIPFQVDETDEIHQYIVSVLERVMQVTEKEYGIVKLVSQAEATVQTRQIRNLQQGLSDIIWLLSSQERVREAKAIPIPIIGGLYGYRVLLIRDSDTRFSSSLSLSSLQKMDYVQGPDWPDRYILEANRFNVNPVPYRTGFRMVNNGFADAYPRAIHEAKLEVKTPVGRSLKVEENVLLCYPNPLFFYVSPKRPQLAERIKVGMEQLIHSGELQRLLAKQTFFQAARENIAGRTIYELDNTYLSTDDLEAVNHYLKQSHVLLYIKGTNAQVRHGEH